MLPQQIGISIAQKRVDSRGGGKHQGHFGVEEGKWAVRISVTAAAAALTLLPALSSVNVLQPRHQLAKQLLQQVVSFAGAG